MKQQILHPAEQSSKKDKFLKNKDHQMPPNKNLFYCGGFVFAQRCHFCAKRAIKIVVPPKEMLLLFSSVRFQTNFLRANQVNGEYFTGFPEKLAA